MGGLTFSVIDSDFSLNPYDIAGNPAWLMNDERKNFLEISPSIKSNWGKLRRIYDPAQTEFYEIFFEGVKNLGEDGTFLGQTTYEYDYREEVYRSLKYHTYSGAAFFMNDTTIGNFRYNGPSMKFMYSFEPIEHLFVGAAAKYKILDGLKSTYSRAQTLYREVYGSVGLAYDFGHDIIAGINFGLDDEQEKIEAKSEDLLDVEIFNFKGETFSVRRRSSSVNQKIRTVHNSFGTHLFIKPGENSELAFVGNAKYGNEKILIPFSISATNESFKEFEDGYASFNDYYLLFIGRYAFTERIMISIKSSYNENSSWSKNSPINLLLWEWTVKNITAGLGSSFRLANNLLVGLEYELMISNMDSSKYVDSRLTSTEGTCHVSRIGAEYLLTDDLFLRMGYNLAFSNEHYCSSPAEKIFYNSFSLGAGIKLFESFNIDAAIEYQRRTVDGDNANERSALQGVITVTLFSL
jgi:hypothetical protein